MIHSDAGALVVGLVTIALAFVLTIWAWWLSRK